MFSNFSVDNLDSSKCVLFTFLNPYSYYKVDESITSNFDYIFSDGILLTLMHNFFNKKNKISRFSFDFTSIASVIFDFSVSKNFNVALVGGTALEAKKAEDVIKSKFPSIKIFSYSGYFDDTTEILNLLNHNHIDVVISGMGTPLQEEFLIECSKNNRCLKLGFTCGGFISQIASNPEYFNKNLSALNLRWLQRFFRHGYVRRRLLIDYPIFILKYSLTQLVRFKK